MTLHFQGGKTAEVEITKDGHKWMYIQTKSVPSLKYRVNKQAGEVQSSPYWNTIKGMYID